MAAKISRVSQIFLDAPLAQTAANFGRKSCFFSELLPRPKLCTKFEVA